MIDSAWQLSLQHFDLFKDCFPELAKYFTDDRLTDKPQFWQKMSSLLFKWWYVSLCEYRNNVIRDSLLSS